MEWDKVGIYVYDDISGGHWFTKETTDKVAWTEGWAEFYAAASHMYWYTTELPAQIEVGARNNESPYARVYQFLDFSISTLIDGRDNTKVEGAVACFFYNLWDGTAQRAPGYSGDNDDISFSGAFLLNKLDDRWDVAGGLLAETHIEAYKVALLEVLDSQEDASVDALYNSGIVLGGSTARPATAQNLTISGSWDSRTLSWDDNTCPNSVTYEMESGYSYTFDLLENNENGFHIYRKKTTASWDGTINGYSLVRTLGANTTTWTDNTDLDGRHSYVLVAYDNGGNSLPQAERAVTYDAPLTVTISGPSSLGYKELGSYTANAQWGISTYYYEWYKKSDGSNTWYYIGSGQTISVLSLTPLDTFFIFSKL